MVMTGSAIAQAIGFALSPIISRLFSPEEFGIFGSFGSVATVIGAGVTLQYSQALMLPKEKGDAFHLLVLSCLGTLVVTGGCAIFCLVAPSFVQDLVKSRSHAVLSLLVVSVLVGGVATTLQAWCVRTKAFRATSVAQVLRSTVSSGSQVALGWAGTGAFGLIISSLLADFSVLVQLARHSFTELRLLARDVSWRRLRLLAWEYRDFPAYSATQNVMNALSVGLPVLLLTHYFDLAVAGAYAFSVRILNTPMSFVLTALRQVLFQKASETYNQGHELWTLFVRTTTALFALAVLPAMAVAVFGPQIFAWVFGQKWLLAGQFSQSLVIWLLLAFCNLPSVLFARLIRIQRTVFIYDVLMLVARSASLIIGSAYLEPTAVIAVFSAVGAGMNVFLIAIVARAIKKAAPMAQTR